MTLTITCKHCGADVTAETEDELVEHVQAHVREHGATHALPREAVLALLKKRAAQEDPA